LFIPKKQNKYIKTVRANNQKETHFNAHFQKKDQNNAQ